MKEKKHFVGGKLRRVRERLGLKQSDVAGMLGVSASYFNQIERDQRPLTPALLGRLVAALNIPETYLVDTEDFRRARHLREALGDPLFRAQPVPVEEIQAAVQAVPGLSDAFMTLYVAYCAQEERLQHLRQNSQVAPSLAGGRSPYDEVRDWVEKHQNYFDGLDRAAESLFIQSDFSLRHLREDLAGYLRRVHGITVAHSPALLAQGSFWRLNKAARRLYLAEQAAPESEIFWMAHVVGQLDCKAMIEREIRRAALSTEEAQGLARIALANYFAGALMMPYQEFAEQARAVKHDLQRLQRMFGASFEQVCHRLSTMQRPDMPGIPFYFAKTDIAGNILKRSSATPFQFAQFGGPCPIWNVFKAFAHPGDIMVQLAVAPDDVMYLNIARTVGRGGGSYLSRPRSVAVVLGCEARHAAQMVYAAGLDLDRPEVADLIGPGCRACERVACRHRSVPPMGHILDVGTAERGVVPYRMRRDG